MMPAPLPGGGASLSDQPADRYSGRQTDADTEVVRHAANGGTSPLPMRLDLRNHSPTGPECGYGGSGPAQLALAILADAIGDRAAQRRYQQFKWHVITTLDKDAWEINRKQVQAWLAQQRGSRRRPVPPPSFFTAE